MLFSVNLDLADRRDAARGHIDARDATAALGDPHLAVGRPHHVPDRAEVGGNRLDAKLLARRGRHDVALRRRRTRSDPHDEGRGENRRSEFRAAQWCHGSSSLISPQCTIPHLRRPFRSW